MNRKSNDKQLAEALDHLAKAMANVGQGSDAIKSINNALFKQALGDFGRPDLSAAKFLESYVRPFLSSNRSW